NLSYSNRMFSPPRCHLAQTTQDLLPFSSQVQAVVAFASSLLWLQNVLREYEAGRSFLPYHLQACLMIFGHLTLRLKSLRFSPLPRQQIQIREVYQLNSVETSRVPLFLTSLIHQKHRDRLLPYLFRLT